MFEINGVSILNREPIGGWTWLRAHQSGHTHAEMESLSIQLGFDGKVLPPPPGQHRGRHNKIYRERKVTRWEQVNIS